MNQPTVRPQRPGVCIELIPGEVLHIDPSEIGLTGLDSARISVSLEQKSGQRARLRIVAPDQFTIQHPKPVRR